MYVCISGVCKVHVLHKCDFMNFSWWCFPSCCISGYICLVDYQIIDTQTTAVFNQQVKIWNVTKVTQGKPLTWAKIRTWAWCPSIGKSKDALQRFLLQTMVSNTLKDLTKQTNKCTRRCETLFKMHIHFSPHVKQITFLVSSSFVNVRQNWKTRRSLQWMIILDGYLFFTKLPVISFFFSS